MSGTKNGGESARQTRVVALGGEEAYQRYMKQVASKGGSQRNPNKGFGTNRELAIKAGTLGGRMKKGKKLNRISGHYESQHIKVEES